MRTTTMKTIILLRANPVLSTHSKRRKAGRGSKGSRRKEDVERRQGRVRKGRAKRRGSGN